MLAARAIGQGREAVGRGDREEEGSAWGGASLHADEHKQSSNNVLRARAIGQGGEATGGGDREEEGGAQGRASFYANEH